VRANTSFSSCRVIATNLPVRNWNTGLKGNQGDR